MWQPCPLSSLKVSTSPSDQPRAPMGQRLSGIGSPERGLHSSQRRSILQTSNERSDDGGPVQQKPSLELSQTSKLGRQQPAPARPPSRLTYSEDGGKAATVQRPAPIPEEVCSRWEVLPAVSADLSKAAPLCHTGPQCHEALHHARNLVSAKGSFGNESAAALPGAHWAPEAGSCWGIQIAVMLCQPRASGIVASHAEASNCKTASLQNCPRKDLGLPGCCLAT